MDSQILWSPGVTLESIEKQVILTAFRFYKGNKTKTSISLGISIRTLDNKLDGYKELNVTEEKRQQDDRATREAFLTRARGNYTPNNVFIGSAEQSKREPAQAVANENKVKTANSGVSAPSGVRVESAPSAPAKSPVSVSQRKKV